MNYNIKMMFSRKLINTTAKPLVQQSKRSYQNFTKTYQTGFDRMLSDKLNWFRVGGTWFALMGLLNLTAYGLHLFMNKDQYRYHFAYRGNKSALFTAFKSMFGSEHFTNVVWTAPCLIGCNLYMMRNVGSLVMTKFFFISLCSSYIFLSAFSPSSGLNIRPLKNFPPFKYDSNADDGSYTMGADQLAQAIFYWTLLYHRMWLVTLPIMAADVLKYGPSTFGGPIAAIAGAFMFF